MNRSKSILIVLSLLMAVLLTGCGFRDSIGPRTNDSAVPSSLAGEWQGTLTACTIERETDSDLVSRSIKFSFTDSTYETDGRELRASGIYERNGESVLILHNDHFYQALWDMRLLPVAYYPLQLEIANDSLIMSAEFTSEAPLWRSWQRIALARVEE